MPYAIYPPISIARVGNSPEFFIGPEQPGSFGVEIHADGEHPVLAFKDASFRVKRQGARFRVFEIGADGVPMPTTFPEGTLVRWSVSIANRKDSIHRPASPPSLPTPIRDDPARQDRAILANGSVVGPNHGKVVLTGSYLDQPVVLGEILTDSDQHLIFLGASGHSASLSVPPAPMGDDFYNNPDWFDDVADGSIDAVIEVPGQPPVGATPAWVVSAPPDFSPPSLGVVTLFDVIKQVAIDQTWMVTNQRPSFETDIRPIIERASGLRWVDASPAWTSISQDWNALADNSSSAANLRAHTATLVREAENALHDFALREWQNAALEAWADGNFDRAARPDRGMCDALTRAALDATVGQGFYPGIEAGINITDPALYESEPFEYRFSSGAMRPGDATAHMAQPWQADFLKCARGWWPTQRPHILPNSAGNLLEWLRPGMTHVELVANVMRLGMATPDSAGRVIEQGRDPTL